MTPFTAKDRIHIMSGAFGLHNLCPVRTDSSTGKSKNQDAIEKKSAIIPKKFFFSPFFGGKRHHKSTLGRSFLKGKPRGCGFVRLKSAAVPPSLVRVGQGAGHNVNYVLWSARKPGYGIAAQHKRQPCCKKRRRVSFAAFSAPPSGMQQFYTSYTASFAEPSGGFPLFCIFFPAE